MSKIQFSTTFRNSCNEAVAGTIFDVEQQSWAISTIPILRFKTEAAARENYFDTCSPETGIPPAATLERGSLLLRAEQAIRSSEQAILSSKQARRSAEQVIRNSKQAVRSSKMMHQKTLALMRKFVDIREQLALTTARSHTAFGA